MFHIQVISNVLKHSFPDTLVTPVCKALVHRVPFSVVGWQKPPLGTAPAYPEYPFNGTATVGLIADIDVRVAFQECPDFYPLFITEFYRYHVTRLHSF